MTGARRVARRIVWTAALALGVAIVPAAHAVALEVNAGDILVVDQSAFGTGAVFQVDPSSGAQTAVSFDVFFVDPFGSAVEADGKIVVGDPAAFGGPGGLIRVDPTTGAQSIVSRGGNLATPLGVAVEADGNILVSDLTGGRVIRVD